MKKIVFFLVTAILSTHSFAQPEDVRKLHETAKSFMHSADFDNAIIVLTRALQQDKNNLEMQKDLAMSYYLKRDYAKALDAVKLLIDREDADEVCFQIAGNVYKALEEVKECDRMYKKALKKFPKSGPLLSEYGELLWAIKDFSAIQYWEEGIRADPSYSGNYYNAARYYFYAKDKIWGLLYAEIFVNMESLGERGTAMKQMLLQAYKEKLYAEADLMKGEEKNNSEFARKVLETISGQSSLASQGISPETLTMMRTRFILSWFAGHASRFPFRLFDYQRQLLTEGLFDAYNQWLFGPSDDLAAYDSWIKTHPDEYNRFMTFQKGRVFRMPPGQYYQSR